MPYITEEKRRDVTPIYEVGEPETAGELNYAITCLIKNYTHYKPNYQKFNDVIGALEGAKLEFYRRVVVPYETKKIHDNGDVYNV